MGIPAMLHVHLIEKPWLVNSMNHEQWDIMEFWENSTASLLLLIFNVFFIHGEIWSICISFIFPCHYDVHGV